MAILRRLIAVSTLLYAALLPLWPSALLGIVLANLLLFGSFALARRHAKRAGR
jgi:hypothetical protein